MKNTEQYTKSLQLIDQFIAEISPVELESLLKKYDEMNIQGPSFDEYLVSLDESFESFCWNQEATNHTIIDECEVIGVYKVTDCDNYYIPPPENLKYTPKKDSALISESFFLLYLHHDRREKSIF